MFISYDPEFLTNIPSRFKNNKVGNGGSVKILRNLRWEYRQACVSAAVHPIRYKYALAYRRAVYPVFILGVDLSGIYLDKKVSVQTLYKSSGYSSEVCGNRT